MSRCYNYIYSQLVENRADIVGHIAYALYKEDKIAYIELFKKNHDGNEPTEEDLKAFNAVSSAKNSIEKYKLVAHIILQTFVDNSIDESRQDIEDDVKNNYIGLMKDVVEPIKPPSLFKAYIHGIAQSVIGAFVFMLILCGLIFILKFSDTQYTFTFGGRGDARLEKSEVVTQDSLLLMGDQN